MNKKDHLKEALRMELARRDFWRFCLFIDAEIFTKRPFLKEVAEAMQQIEDGEILSLSVSLPPRAGKSYITSLFCAWVIGRNPEKSVMRNTCTATLYLKFSYDVRAIVKSDKFKKVFDVELSQDKSNLQGWNTNSAKMVSYFGAGVGGTIIGFGASKVAITDDLYRGIEDALSDTVNDRVIQWKTSTHDSRLEKGCSRIDIGTRWSINDVIGRSMEAGEYEKSIVIQALDNSGRSFCEDVHSTAEYEDIRKKTPREIWQAEYQQEPVDLEGRLFSNLETITPAELEILRPKIAGCIAYIDVADQGKDYLAAAVGALIDGKIYIVETLFTRENTDITIGLAAALLNKWGVAYCRVESNNMGAMFSRILQKQTKTRILQIVNQSNKITRIIMQSAVIMNYFVFVNNNTPSHILFMQNVHGFSKEGKNKNDDAPDCLAGLSMFAQAMFKQLFIYKAQ